MSTRAATLDRSALEKLYKRLEKPIYNVVYRSLWSVSASQDVVHDAFLRLWDMRERVDVETVDPLVWKIALNLASKRRRWLRLRRFVGLAPSIADQEMGADAALAGHAQRTAVRAAVEALPDSLREVVVLTAFSNLTYQQVSGVLNIPEGTVGSRRNKALALLREQLKEYDVRSI